MTFFSIGALVKYWCITLYHICKIEYIELKVVKVLIRVIIERKK